jgi:hypothetical protein
MFLVPCSCGITFAVAENYDHQDPKNRLLQMGFHPEGYWKVDEC